MSKRANPGNSVVRAVLDLLGYEKVWAQRMNSGAQIIPGNGNPARRFVQFGSKGMADVLATPYIIFQHPGCGALFTLPAVLWIECKFGTGRQSADQKEFEQLVTSAGHFYLLAKSSDDVLAWLKLRRSTPWSGQ